MFEEDETRAGRCAILLATFPGPRALQHNSSTVAVACPLTETDCTSALQSALEAPGVTEVVVPAVPRAVWPVKPLVLGAAASNRRIVLTKGVVIEAMKGEFHGGADALITCDGATNVTIVGGDGTPSRGRYRHQCSGPCRDSPYI